MWHVLAVEDSLECQRLIAKALDERVRLSTASSVAEARSQIERELPDFILLDVELPDGDGYQLCTLLQNDERTRDIPILFLTGRTETQGKLLAFAAGADDFVTKPFDRLELRARIESRLAKLAARNSRSEVLRVGDLRLDIPRYRAVRVEDGRDTDLQLTPHEFRLLHHLAAREGRVLSRPHLCDAVWGDVVVNERTVDTHISNLRRKLGPLGGCLQAVRGVGYRFSLPGD